MLAAVKYDLQMQPIPRLTRKESLEIFFGLNDVFSVGQSPSLGQTMNMCIDWKGRHTECLSHNDRSGFVPDSR